MIISPDKHVSIHYTLTLDNGEVADSSKGGEPLGFVHGCGQIIPGLEKALDGKKTGDSFTVTIPPAEAYGERSDEMHRELPRESFPNDIALEPGMAFTAEGPMGPVTFTVVSAGLETVVADFGHPLAGRTLTFDIEVVSVNELSADELALMKGALDDAGGCGGGCSGCGPDDCSPAGCGGGCGCN